MPVAVARSTWAANDIPDWQSVSEMFSYVIYKNRKMPTSVYVLGADALQEQIDHYPWSMDNPGSYDELADFYFYAKDKEKAIEAENRAIEKAKKTASFKLSGLKELQ